MSRREAPTSPEGGRSFSNVRIRNWDGTLGDPKKVERVSIEEDGGELVLRFRILGGSDQVWVAKRVGNEWVAEAMD